MIVLDQALSFIVIDIFISQDILEVFVVVVTNLSSMT